MMFSKTSAILVYTNCVYSLYINFSFKQYTTKYICKHNIIIKQYKERKHKGKKMISTGNKDIDEFLEGYKEEITMIYGPPASGKTTLATIAALKQAEEKKRVVYLDTENGFNIERAKQLASGKEELLQNIIVLKIRSFKDQIRKFELLKQIVKKGKVGLVVVDTISHHYRVALIKNAKETNNSMAEQLKQLRLITKENIPVLITTQVYTDPKNNEIKCVGGDMVCDFSKKIIELGIEPRFIRLKKPEKKEMRFKILENGIQKTQDNNPETGSKPNTDVPDRVLSSL
ncbi:MAG: AAA family ATPase [archaeon]